ncbi:MAG: hypothetical protein KDC80_23885 [Saprospiraceae bacterium]|nr:hypothetical protein [Saprospiraceae bacterium]
MAQSKIQNLLQKINSIVGDGESMSRLEKDLVKDYLRELYELTDAIPFQGAVKDRTAFSPDKHPSESTPVKPVNQPYSEPEKSTSVSTPVISREEVNEPIKARDSYVPNGKKESFSHGDSTAEVKEAPRSEPGTEHLTRSAEPFEKEPEPTEPVVPEVFRKEVPVPRKYETLFEYSEAKELSDKLSRSPISDLNRAFSINDRLLIVADLFANDQQKFQETIDILNTKYSFEDAKSYLLRYIVERFSWIDEDRSERAREFIKLVERRYLNH